MAQSDSGMLKSFRKLKAHHNYRETRKDCFWWYICTECANFLIRKTMAI